MTLVSTEWLNNNLSKVKIFDASWHLPNSKRDAKKKYLEKGLKAAKWLISRAQEKNGGFRCLF